MFHYYSYCIIVIIIGTVLLFHNYSLQSINFIKSNNASDILLNGQFIKDK